jgi:glycosyltransferase involved in cell wall biosynthesis
MSLINDYTIGIIVPVYNGGGYLKETLDSLLAQTYSNLYIIIVDDDSTEKLTLDIEKEYEKNNNNIEIIRKYGKHYNKPKTKADEALRLHTSLLLETIWTGYLRSKQLGLSLISVFGQDDILPKEHYQVYIDALQKFNCDAVQCKSFYNFINSSKIEEVKYGKEEIEVKTKESKSYSQDFDYIEVMHNGSLVKRNLFDKVDFNLMTNNVGSDVLLGSWVGWFAEKLVITNQTTIFYRINSGASNNPKKFFKYPKSIFDYNIKKFSEIKTKRFEKDFYEAIFECMRDALFYQIYYSHKADYIYDYIRKNKDVIYGILNAKTNRNLMSKKRFTLYNLLKHTLSHPKIFFTFAKVKLFFRFGSISIMRKIIPDIPRSHVYSSGLGWK